MTYKVLTPGDPRHLAMRPVPGWEPHTAPPHVGPPSIAQLPPHEARLRQLFGRFFGLRL